LLQKIFPLILNLSPFVKFPSSKSGNFLVPQAIRFDLGSMCLSFNIVLGERKSGELPILGGGETLIFPLNHYPDALEFSKALKLKMESRVGAAAPSARLRLDDFRGW
jgi:hypothetical protein